MNSVRFLSDFEVLSRNADASGRLSVRAMVMMLFDSADLHAAQWRVSLGQLAAGRHTWVLSRLHLRLEHHPLWDEPVTIVTWPTGARRILAGRDFEIRTGERRIGLATTLWLMIDRTTRRPVALPAFVSSIAPPENSPVVKTRTDWEDPDPATSAPVSETVVGWNDLDLNRHASASSYLDWILGHVPPECRESHDLVGLDILFKNEAFIGDRIAGHRRKIERDTGTTYTHLVNCPEGDRVLATGRTVWGKAQDRQHS